MSTIKYAGIGSRKTPDYVLKWMRGFGCVAARLGFLLRSGGANGADITFEIGCDTFGGLKEIFLPWPEFNGSTSLLHTPSTDAFELAEQIYGDRWNLLSHGSKKMMARNCHQILGPDLDDRVDFVVCWTPDGATTAEERSKATGGTGQAIALASSLGIPIFNVKNEGVTGELMDYIANLIDLDEFEVE